MTPPTKPSTASPETPTVARRRWWNAPDVTAVTVGELAVLGITVAIGVLATASLATAHLGVLSLGTVGVGAFTGLAVLAVAWRLAGTRPRMVIDWPGLAVITGSAALAALFFWPGFHYAAGERDPGAYMEHAFAMARERSYDFIDPVLADPDLPVQVESPNARFPAVWVADMETGRVVPQFYHYWPALLATAVNLRGFGGAVAVTPLVGVLAVAVAVAAVRRAVVISSGDGPFSLIAATITGVLLSTNMMQVWQAKYPTAEMLAQLLFIGTALCLVLTLQTGWRWPAGTGGLLLAMGMLNRADGVLLVIAVVAVGCALWILRRFDARTAWFAGGLFVLLPYAVWQAYGPALSYTMVNTMLPLRLVLGVIIGGIVAALVLRPLLTVPARWINGRVVDPGWQRIAGAVVVLGCLGLFGLGIVRPFLFGKDFEFARQMVQRTYDELTIYRLAWFLTWPGWLLLLGGIAVIALRRWRPAAWTVVVPVLVLLPIYLFHARNSPYLMWWSRRFVSTVLVGMLVLIAVALAWMATRRVLERAGLAGRLAGPVIAGGLATFLVATNISQSWPLRAHDEWDGTYGIGEEIADLAGNDQGVFLWEKATYCCDAPQSLWGGPLWLIQDQISVLLPADLTMVPGYIATYAEHFADQPVFVIIETPEALPTVSGYELVEVEDFAGGMEHWEESSDVRPSKALILDYDFTVYQVVPAAP